MDVLEYPLSGASEPSVPQLALPQPRGPLMDLQALKDDLEAAIRTLRLAQRQVSNIRRKCVKADEAVREELDAIEVMLEMLVKKAEALKP